MRSPEASHTEGQAIEIVEEKPVILNMSGNSRKEDIVDLLHWLNAFTYTADKCVFLKLVSTYIDSGKLFSTFGK